MPLGPIEALARRWVPGGGPVVIEALAPGLVNESYRIERAGRQFSLRVVAANSVDLGLDREWECRVLRAAAAAGLAPCVACCDPVQGIQVADWISGRAWTAAEIRQPGHIDAMARLLRRVHALPPPTPARVMDPGAWIAHYAGALSRRGRQWPPRLAALRDAADARLASLGRAPPLGAVLCHSDLHRANIVSGERVVVLDWEYAHVSDASWDIAGWVANNDWTEVDAVLLLAGYLQRPPAAAEVIRLQVSGWLYDFVCLMWSELYLSMRPGHGSRDVAERAAALAMRLRTGPGSRAG